MATSRRPNVLFLMTDHTRSRAIGPDGPARTPNLDALAADGVRFERATTTNAICSPARASLMTGLYPSTHGMWDCTHTQRPEWVDVPPGRFPFFSERLAEAGYRNAYFGKWHVEQSLRLEAFGWHEYDVKATAAMGVALPAPRVVLRNPGYRDALVAGALDDTAPVRHPAFDRAIDFVRRHAAAGGDSPFCCFVSTSEPHDPYLPPKRFLDLHDPARVPLSPTLRDPPEGKPEVVRRLRAVWAGLTDDDWRLVTAAYHAAVSFIDAEIGRLLAAVKEAGLYDDTLIVFTSDHGDMLGGHGLCTKGIGTPYEEVYNIPLLLRRPGGPRGPVDATTRTGLIDLAPTLLDLCGARAIEGAQGRSLRPVLEGRAQAEEWQDAYAEFFGQRFVQTQRLVWHGDWKYVFSPGGTDELYDLGRDPHERRNLAGDPACRGTLEDMARRMWAKMKAVGDNSLFNSQYPNLRLAPVGPEGSE
jgi:arylsulfatase A-like enzyme